MVIIEYGKLKAAESQRSVSEFACPTRLDPCEGHLSHCSPVKTGDTPHYTARRQVRVMNLTRETREQELQTESHFLFTRILPGY